MSNNIVSSIETLPVELFHRIFDDLDAQTILYSIRPLSRLFRSIVNTYNRYVLNFYFASKASLYLFCRLIHPQNIISLTLSNDERTLDQIDLFISVICLYQLTRLRSLTLTDIDESQLNYILKRININSLISFSFNIRKNDDKLTETTIALLASTITRTNLHKLEFNTCNKIPKLSCPVNSITDYLIKNNRINIVDLCKILQFSPHLHTLIMNDIPEGVIDHLTSKCFRQLTSLTIQNLSVTLDELELFLLWTPSLVYLKLIGGEKIINAKRWEAFIQINLPQLDKFEFYISVWRSTKPTLTDLKLTIALFQTPFWTEHKKWFVTCEYVYTILGPHIMSLYSIPICTSHMSYTSESEKISLSTYPAMMNNDLTAMDNIKSLSLILNKSTAMDIQEKCATVHQSLFRQVTEIDLQFCSDWPSILSQSLFIFIDISRIVHLKIFSNYLNEYNPNLLIDLKIILQHAHNLFSLFIHSSFYRHKFDISVENIYSILPYYVKYLQIPIDNLNQINLILERCENLSIIEFDIGAAEFCEQVINWFGANTTDTRYRKSGKMVTVWLGKKRIRSNKTFRDHKRIKFL